ncbi:apolipoprotein N-acyltransferase [Aporhodopirellula aestuarii]|uniref:Apolipoprotein N-acyltransferase n=1 Tax=Aporhodopirellula aestuarii TaxID=2950107 RepID=A0ABT0U9E7_9BACT|nr:nitrilase-related carbon-nitrogen hydrolase [Aporhodopirellula aestuarii]MCM2373520.1 apolipoprotein N-acyltransferase [Aporhodopirellula aestuarii]
MKSQSKSIWAGALISVTLLYLTGPTTNLWLLALIALAPLFWIAKQERARWKAAIYFAFFGYYFVSLQGLRYAHPLMVLPLIALAGYLAVYPLLFLAMIRQWLRIDRDTNSIARITRGIPFALVAAVIWVGGECLRNYFATGISVLMLGHSLAGMSHPTLIQIADCFGSYGVSFLIVVVNVAVADLAFARWSKRHTPEPADELTTSPLPTSEPSSRWKVACVGWQSSLPIAIVALVSAHVYGSGALQHETTDSDVTFLLVGRDEQTEYQQDQQRELDIFSAYARQSITAVRRSERPIDAVVWPESMLSGGQPWYIAEDDLVVPAEMRGGGYGEEMSAEQMRQIISQTRDDFTRRSVDLVSAMASGDPPRSPSIIGGCGVVRYGKTAKQFSGVIHIGPDGQVRNTYAKNHLVMFGEYIPLIKSIPVLKAYVPPGLGLDAGTGPAVFRVASLNVLPNLCIETAVERVSVNHMRAILQDDPDSLPDVIVTLTNDAWFDHSAVVAHHLRCAQMVSVGCRRPILSAANGGPTAWIDSSGRVVEKLSFDTAGEILAEPKLDDRVSTYVRYGATPVLPMAAAWLVGLAVVLNKLWRRRPFFRRDDR